MIELDVVSALTHAVSIKLNVQLSLRRTRLIRYSVRLSSSKTNEPVDKPVVERSMRRDWNALPFTEEHWIPRWLLINDGVIKTTGNLANDKCKRVTLQAPLENKRERMLIRYRFNTMADQSPGGEWKWRVILETSAGFEEVLVKTLEVRVPSFSQEDDMPVVGRKYHMACRGRFCVEDGVGIVDPV
jgi:hypothetical protein